MKKERDNIAQINMINYLKNKTKKLWDLNNLVSYFFPQLSRTLEVKVIFLI